MDIKSIFKKDYIIGLDIGSSSVKMAQFIRKEGRLHLIKADLKELNPADSDTRREEEVIFALKALSREADFRKSEVIASINCPRTALKRAVVPYMPKAELYEGVMLEAKNYFPFSVEDSAVDFEIINDIVEKGVRKYEIIVGVSPKNTIAKNLECLKKAGIKVASCIPASYALRALARQIIAAKDTETICFLDIGAVNTELLICSARGRGASGGGGHYLVFNRKIPVAGADFTKALTSVLTSDKGRLALSLPEAEKVKRDVGIPSGEAPGLIENKVSANQVLSMIRQPIDNLISEIERCFDYYREESDGGKVDSLVLFGGGASLSGLVAYLSTGLGVEVKLGDSLDGLEIGKGAVREPEKISHRIDSAIGAALTGERGINLLPPEMKEKTKRVVTRGAVEAALAAVIVISLLLYAGMRIQLGNIQKRIAVSKLELSSIQFDLKGAEDMILAGKIVARELYWEDVLKELSNIIPDDIHLQEIMMRDDILKIKGVASSEEGEQAVSAFMRVLENGIFKEVKVISMKDLAKGTGNQFELTCSVE